MQAVHDLVSSRFLSTRGGTIAVGAFAALLSGAVLLVYLNRYRSSVNASAQPVAVLVASSLIEKGTPGKALSDLKQFQLRDIPRDQVQEGALTDAATLRGRVAVQDVLPGQQLTVADFSAATSDALGTRLIARQRAISVPVDTAHGILGQIEAGDRVDVYGAFNETHGAVAGPVIVLLAQNVPVLQAPAEETKARREASVALRLKSLETSKVAYAVENGKVWFVLRPRAGAKPTPPTITRMRDLLFGVKPIRVKP
jgi:Flp pilus assembly protein CpaB